MKAALQRFLLWLAVVLAEVVPRLLLVVLGLAAMAVTVYVCSRKSGLFWIEDERTFMRTLFPGIF